MALTVAISSGAGLAQQTVPSKDEGAPRVVKLSLIVTDPSNHSVDDLKQDDIQIFEDKSPQTLSVFSKDDRPINYVLAIDNSGSFKNLLPAVLEAAQLIVSGNKELDETMLIRFISSDKIEWVEKFTADESKLLEKLKRLKVEGGQSAVIDALYVAVEAVTEHKQDDLSIRRAVVLISDGEDRASYYTLETLVKLLRVRNVQVFVIGIVDQLDDTSGLTRPSPRAGAEKLLNRIALESGGRAFFPNKIGQLKQAIAEIIHDLHVQYIIGYESKNPASKENFRKIEVKIDPAKREELKAVTRPGYFINPPDLDGKEKKKKPE